MLKFFEILRLIDDVRTSERTIYMILITYSTDVWGFGIRDVASMIYIWMGIAYLMPWIFFYLTDNYVGSYWMLVLSTTISASGMGLLALSLPSWLYSSITGSCNEYKVECISETQQSLFYFSLILILVGKSAREAAIGTLNFKNSASEQQWNKETVKLSNPVHYVIVVDTIPWSWIFAYYSVNCWKSVYWLMDKSWSHKLDIDDPLKSPINTVLRVFGASIFKKFKGHPYQPFGSYRRLEKDDSRLLRRSKFRLLEKAAIPPPNDKGACNRLTLCRFQEVKNAKMFLRMLPVGGVAIVLLLISSISKSCFIHQAKRIKPMFIFGNEFFDMSTLIRLYFHSKDQVYENVSRDLENKKKYDTRKGVKKTVISATLCYLIAALVEKLRLNVIRTHGLQNKPEEIIPMTVLWLFPQFYLIGQIDAHLEQIILKFCGDGKSMTRFKIFVVDGLIGAGMMFSVLFVYVVGKVSQIRGGLSWFQHDTENSRLDLFYSALTMLCVVVSTIWFLVPSYFDKLDTEAGLINWWHSNESDE